MRAAMFLRPVLRLLLGAGVTVSSGAQDLVLTEQDNGKTVSAVIDQSIRVNLRGNPSTGYTWLLTSTNGASVIASGPAEYTPDPNGGPGRGGTFSFPFRAVGLGATTVTLTYLQPWDPASVAQTFVATIAVSPDTLGPRLSVTRAGNEIVISWPQTGSNGFYLEGTPSLSPPSWAALNVLPLAVGSDYQVTLEASSPTLLFRLRK